MPISKSSRYSKDKHKSYWELMDGLEKFMAVFLMAAFGFFIYIIYLTIV